MALGSARRLGGNSLRQGRWGTRTFQFGQWYPRLAMYDDVLGWDRAPHEGFAEFNNNFADYEVDVRVPEGWLVGATGSHTNPDETLTTEVRARLRTLESEAPESIVHVGAATSDLSGTLRTWTYSATSVRDFAWAASADFEWIAARSEGGALVHGFTTSDHLVQYREALIEAGRAMDRLTSVLGPPNTRNHVLVDGPEGGMEYPGLTMSHGDRMPHEISHQWFPMTVGTDESRYNFLDEGLASFLLH